MVRVSAKDVKANDVKIQAFSRNELNWMLVASRAALASHCRQRVGAVVVSYSCLQC